MSPLAGLRVAVLAAALVSLAVALASWAVRTRRVNPFGWAGRWLRRLSDPLIVPLERWVVRRGGHPTQAPWWLVGLALGGGIVVLTLAQWVAVEWSRLSGAAAQGPRGVLRLAIASLGQLVLLALIVRVVASWFGWFRFHPAMRPIYWLTDWIVEPLGRLIPPIGMFDVTPLVAWLVVRLAVSWLLRVL